MQEFQACSSVAPGLTAYLTGSVPEKQQLKTQKL